MDVCPVDYESMNAGIRDRMREKLRIGLKKRRKTDD